MAYKWKGKWRWKKVRRDLPLRLAIREAGKRAGQHQGGNWSVAGKRFLAEGLGITFQAVDQWKTIPRGRVMMVHQLTGVPLKVLAPDLFKE